MQETDVCVFSYIFHFEIMFSLFCFLFIHQVVVRDVVSKSIVTQFRAHKHPISSLCFDPSGTLLVTASDQGHNINVFRIIPELSGGSSGAASGPSHVHLYRLQRGVTPAVRTKELFFYLLICGCYCQQIGLI